MTALTIIMPLPNYDFDPTEVAVTWRIIRAAGHGVKFATPDGQRAHTDPLMISGEGLDPWGFIPGLKKVRAIGLMLRAQAGAREAYAALEKDADFLHPCRYSELKVGDYNGMVLPGGHAKRMRAYLEDKTLQAFVVDFFESADSKGQHKPIAAVCHGVLLAARSISPRTGRSVLYGRRTTALTWKLENSAWMLTRFLARFWDPLYYRTYAESAGEPKGYWGVESEIKRLLANPSDFVDVNPAAPAFFQKSSGMVRDSDSNSQPAWVVRDGNYISARWPGDVHTFAKQYVSLLGEYSA